MKLALPLVERMEVARRTLGFGFDLEGRSFPFKPGQYVTVTIPEPPYRDDKGSSREFSIASAPGDPHLLVATRMTGSAFKRSLAEVPLGTRIGISGPSGAFVLHRDPEQQVVLVAGGIGITPFRSMIKTAVEGKLPHRLTLLSFNRAPEDAPFSRELEGWASQSRSFRLVAAMTAPGQSKSEWHGPTGRPTAPLLREMLGDLGPYVFYVAGPEAMVEGATAALIEAGADPNDVLTEGFPGY